MLKQCFTILFLVAFGMQTFQQGLLYAGFYAKQDFIAKNLCENKSRPKMHCNGKCQLMKKMKQEEKNDKENPGRKSENKQEVLSSKSFFTSVFNTGIAIGTTYSFPDTKKPVDRAFTLFHPPGIA